MVMASRKHIPKWVKANSRVSKMGGMRCRQRNGTISIVEEVSRWYAFGDVTNSQTTNNEQRITKYRKWVKQKLVGIAAASGEYIKWMNSVFLVSLFLISIPCVMDSTLGNPIILSRIECVWKHIKSRVLLVCIYREYGFTSRSYLTIVTPSLWNVGNNLFGTVLLYAYMYIFAIVHVHCNDDWVQRLMTEI